MHMPPETRTLFSSHKTYTKPSTFVKYAIKLVGAANPITYFKYVNTIAIHTYPYQAF
jgi:hypothetical protein